MKQSDRDKVTAMERQSDMYRKTERRRDGKTERPSSTARESLRPKTVGSCGPHSKEGISKRPNAHSWSHNHKLPLNSFSLNSYFLLFSPPFISLAQSLSWACLSMSVPFDFRSSDCQSVNQILFIKSLCCCQLCIYQILSV